MKNDPDVQSVLEGQYTNSYNMVNNYPYWIQVEGSNALWYAKTGWGFGSLSVLGYGYEDHVGLVLFSSDNVDEPYLVNNWIYWNSKSGWKKAKTVDVNLQCVGES